MYVGWYVHLVTDRDLITFIVGQTADQRTTAANQMDSSTSDKLGRGRFFSIGRMEITLLALWVFQLMGTQEFHFRWMEEIPDAIGWVLKMCIN